jgi:hypothetical protein
MKPLDMDRRNVKIGKYLNEELWKHGMKNPPHHVKIITKKDDKGIVKAELFGAAVEEKKAEKGKEAEKKTETKKEAPKTEVKEKAAELKKEAEEIRKEIQEKKKEAVKPAKEQKK